MKEYTLVFGASLKQERISNRAVLMLQEYNIPTHAFGMREGVLGKVTIDTELKDYEDIETISLYMNPKRLLDYWEYLLSLQPKRIIFNPGTESTELIEDALDRGILAEAACTLVLLRSHQYKIGI